MPRSSRRRKLAKKLWMGMNKHPSYMECEVEVTIVSRRQRPSATGEQEDEDGPSPSSTSAKKTTCTATTTTTVVPPFSCKISSTGTSTPFSSGRSREPTSSASAGSSAPPKAKGKATTGKDMNEDDDDEDDQYQKTIELLRRYQGLSLAEIGGTNEKGAKKIEQLMSNYANKMTSTPGMTKAEMKNIVEQFGVEATILSMELEQMAMESDSDEEEESRVPEQLPPPTPEVKKKYPDEAARLKSESDRGGPSGSEVAEDYSSSSCEDDDEEDEEDYDLEYENEEPAACEDCSKSRCSNCLTPFKRGDKVVREIPTTVASMWVEEFISLEAALICVFDPTGPYMKWARRDVSMRGFSGYKRGTLPLFLANKFQVDLARMDRIANAGIPKPKEHIQTEEEAEEFCKLRMKRIVRLAEEEFSDSDFWTDEDRLLFVKKLISNLRAPVEKNEPCTKEVDSSLEMVTESIFQQYLKDRKDFETKREQMTKAVADIVMMEQKTVPNFQFCEGCGQLLTVLFMTWERLRSGHLNDDNFFPAVLLAFQEAEVAKALVEGRSGNRRIRRLNKYACVKPHPRSCCGPEVGTGTKKDKDGSSIPDGDRYGMKMAVGHLLFFLEGSYLQVYSEVTRQVTISVFRKAITK